MPPPERDGPVDVTLVLEGGRVGAELGSMALLELGSALAAVTEIRGGTGAPAPRWIGDAVPSTSGGAPETVLTAGVTFPSLAAARAAVRRCALTRMALAPVASGDPSAVAFAMGPERAAKCAAQVLAPGRKGVPRVVLERVGAELWDAGVGRAVAADRAWLIAVAASEEKPGADERRALDPTPLDLTPHVYLHPEATMCEVIAWGLDTRAALHAVEAPNAMPPQQAFLACNAARIRPGDVVCDPCVGGGAALLAALKLGASRVVGADVDDDALAAAAGAMRRDGIDVNDYQLGRASLLDTPWQGPSEGEEWDAIVTDLPYGVRSAAIGVGDGPNAVCTPRAMLLALLDLANARLRRGGRIAAWLRNPVEGGAETNGNTGREASSSGAAALTEADVAAAALTRGFWVERAAGEARKTGVSRALYVMVRVEEAGCCKRGMPRDEEDGDASGVISISPASETFGSDAHERNRRALVMHATLRRNENYGRVENDGGADVWRAAWVGDLPGLRTKLDSHPLVAAATEPAGAGNTPLSAAAGFGRVSCVAELARRLDRLNSEFEGKRDDAVAAALVRAAEFGHASAAAYLLRECGADPGTIRRGGGDGGNALHAAAERGHSDVLETLLENIRGPDALLAEDANGRTPAEAAARWGHADALRVFLQTHRSSSNLAVQTPSTNLTNLTNLCAVAVRWGHEDALRPIVEIGGRDATRAALSDVVAAEAARWSRGKIAAILESWSTRNAGDTRPPSVEGARVVRWEPRTGGAVLYCPMFWNPDEGVRSLREQVERDFLPRAHPLVTPANRRGRRSAVPRDQAFYAASYAAKAPDALDKTRDEPLEGEGVWWCSYRYNPSHTQQPAPRAPPPVVKALSREVHRRCGQTCNHAVVNRYRDGFDAIGAHGDKDTDLEDGSFVVSVSFGATRRMVFEPRVEAPSADGSGRVVRAADVKAAQLALAGALNADNQWMEIAVAKKTAAPRSEAKAAAVARERARGAVLRDSDPRVAAAAREARETRAAWKAAKGAASFAVDLEPGSAVFFNMAFNAAWTHAIYPVGGYARETEEEEEDNGEEGKVEEDGEEDGEEEESDEDVDESRTEPLGVAVGERFGVTLRRCKTVFDPVRQARAEGKPRGWRKGIWRPLGDMVDPAEAEREWREGG